MKSKKLLLGSLSAMALVATPIATVVSCGKKDSAADKKAAEAKVSIVKATTDDYVLTKDGKNYLVSKDDAAKAGSLVIGAETFTWDAALTTSTNKLKNDADKSDVTVTVAKATADHFGLKTETGTQYFDASGLKTAVGLMLLTEEGVKTTTGITLKFDDKKKIVKASLDELNKLLKPGSLELETVTTDDSGTLKLGWKSAAAKPVVNADLTAVKSIKDAIEQLTGAVTVEVHAVTTAGTTSITDKASLIAAIKASASNTAVVATISAELPALNGAKIVIKSIPAIAASGAVKGDLVLTITKGNETLDATIVITGAQ